MSVGGGGSPSQSTGPWKGQKPYLLAGYGRANQTYADDINTQYYGGPTQVGYGDAARAGMRQMQALANSGGTLTPAASSELERTIRGDYLGGGEFMRAYGQDIMDSVNSQFARGGRSGSGYQAKALGSSLGDAAARLYSGERDRQMQATGLAPSMDAARYADADMLRRLGEMQDRREIDAGMAKWDWENQRDNLALQNYLAAIGGNVGSTTTTSGGTGGALGALGGATAGAGLAGTLGLAGPWGWGLAAAGGLLGAL